MATRRNLTYREKLAVLEALDRGDRSRQEVAASFSIAIPTLLRIIRTRDSIAQLGVAEGERTRIRQPTYAEIEDQLLVWVTEQNNEGAKVSGKMIKEKASEIAIQMEIFNFPASNGWLDNFRRRNGFNKNNEVGVDISNRVSNIILSYEPDHGTPILLPKKRKMEGRQKEVIMYPSKSASRMNTMSRRLEIIDMAEEQAQEEEVVLLEQPTSYAEEAEYTREDAREAHQILIAYFNANPPPPGTYLSLQRIGEAIGDEPEVYVEGEEGLIEEVEGTGSTDDNVSLEVEIEESYLE